MKWVLIIRKNDTLYLFSIYQRYSKNKWFHHRAAQHFRKTSLLADSFTKCKKVTIGFASMKFKVGACEIFDILNFSDRGKPSDHLRAFIDSTLRPSNGYSLRSASHESHFVALYSSGETRLLLRDALYRGYIFSRWAVIVFDRIEIPIPIYQEGAVFQEVQDFLLRRIQFYVRSNRILQFEFEITYIKSYNVYYNIINVFN